jgi:Protein of unknown function (DUF2971)
MDLGALLMTDVLQNALNEYRTWNKEQVEFEQANTTVQAPLYHYTNLDGLTGILTGKAVWATDYRHLNDPSELKHGIERARELMAAMSLTLDGRACLFLQMVNDLLSSENFDDTLRFFVISLSKARDDLGQWRSYGDNGRGFALGLAPEVFAPTDVTDLKPNEIAAVGPVSHDDDIIRARHAAPIGRATDILLKTVTANVDLFRDKNVGIPFMRNLANELLASPTIWNCLTSKHAAYQHEQEVRLIVLGLAANLAPYVETRDRSGVTVPYVVRPLPIEKAEAIVEIVVGPAAPCDAEDKVRSLLATLGLSSVKVCRSMIPYRAQ